MAETITLEPDLGFIKDVSKLGGGDLKKCYQCATCSVACKISPDNKPFPRKEMIAASWGLKDRLLSDPDVWLCYHCNDCSSVCPRGGGPGSVLAAVREELAEVRDALEPEPPPPPTLWARMPWASAPWVITVLQLVTDTCPPAPPTPPAPRPSNASSWSPRTRPFARPT